MRASSEPVAGVLAATRVDVVATPDLGDVSKVEIVASSIASVRWPTSASTACASTPARQGSKAARWRTWPSEGEWRSRAWQAGVVVASKVEFENDDATSEFELKGLISGFVDVGHFIVRATPVDASGSVTYEGGSALNLRDGACVEVKGTLQSTSAGSKVLASRVQFESSCN
ncbi:MAG: DUF5666 domain-containing protein [Burkholderiaceae bacterium]